MKNNVLREANRGLQELAAVYGLCDYDNSQLGDLVQRVIRFTNGSPCIPEGAFYPGRNLRILCKLILIEETVKLIYGLTSIEEVTELYTSTWRSDYFWWEKSEYIATRHRLALPEHSK